MAKTTVDEAIAAIAAVQALKETVRKQDEIIALILTRLEKLEDTARQSRWGQA